MNVKGIVMESNGATVNELICALMEESAQVKPRMTKCSDVVFLNMNDLFVLAPAVEPPKLITDVRGTDSTMDVTVPVSST